MSAQIKIARMQNVGRAMPGTGFRGDPGLFGSIGNFFKGAAGLATGVVGGLNIPFVSGISRGIQSIIGNKRQLPKGRQLGGMAFLPRQGTFPPLPMQPFAEPSRFKRGVQQILPGGKTGLEVAPGMGAPAGYHVNKSSYFLQSGEFIPAGTRWVKNRKRNPLNPRAWDRALSRLESANNFKKRLARVTIRPRACKT